ncbi:MAG: hypothetical protein JNJ98_15865 [Gemmatimonadetes bacterium]|nr:hypothetical protein [Gemmatimonadota bacterium]
MALSLPVIIGVCLLAFATVASAQPVVTPGARIRLVQTDSRTVAHVGTFVRLSGDTLALQDKLGVVRTLPMTGYRVEVGGGLHRHVGTGALLGAGVGLAAGFVFVTSFDNSVPCGSNASGDCVVREAGEALAMGFVVVGAGAGAIIGAIIGLVPHERWTPAVLQPQVSFSPNHAGWRLGFKLTL